MRRGVVVVLFSAASDDEDCPLTRCPHGTAEWFPNGTLADKYCATVPPAFEPHKLIVERSDVAPLDDEFDEDGPFNERVDPTRFALDLSRASDMLYEGASCAAAVAPQPWFSWLDDHADPPTWAVRAGDHGRVTVARGVGTAMGYMATWTPDVGLLMARAFKRAAHRFRTDQWDTGDVDMHAVAVRYRTTVLARRMVSGGTVPQGNRAVVPVDGNNPCGKVSPHEPHLIGTMTAPVQCLGRGGYDG